MNHKQLLKYATLALVFIAFILSHWTEGSHLTFLAFASLLFIYPHDILNRWMLTIFGGVFIYQLITTLIKSQEVFTTPYSYITFALCLLSVIMGLAYQLVLFKGRNTSTIRIQE